MALQPTYLKFDTFLKHSFMPSINKKRSLWNHLSCSILAKLSGSTVLILLVGAHSALAQCPMPANTPAGTLDTCFALSDTGLISSVNTIALQADGKVLVGGSFTTLSGSIRHPLCRLNSDGSLDASFALGTGISGDVKAVIVQPDSKVLVGGGFASFNGTSRNRLCRLNVDGSLDASFAIGTGFDIGINTLALQSNGKIIVGGSFTLYNGIVRNRLCRLNPDGTLDPSFTIGRGFNNPVTALAIQPDGKVIVGGDFTSYDGTAQGHLCRLNPDGSLDATFDQSGSGFNHSVYALALQPDGKVIVGGAFNSYDGTIKGRICRLYNDGSLDVSFAVGTGFDGSVSSLALQSDSKVLAGGYFTSYSGSTRNHICRLNGSGTLDTTFRVGSGFTYPVYALALQPDGKVLAGTDLSSYNGASKNYLMRLFATSTVTENKPFLSLNKDFYLYPNPATGTVQCKYRIPSESIHLMDLNGKVIRIYPAGHRILSLEDLRPGLYLVRIGQQYSRLAVE